MNLARKAAALEAIKQLHIKGELDDHLKPISHKDVDSDEEDEVKMTEKKKRHAGTQRKVMYYRNEVSIIHLSIHPSICPLIHSSVHSCIHLSI